MTGVSGLRLRNDDGPPATPRDAATVAVVRDGYAGLEVFLLHRVTGMAFAGGMTVFPGGGVDPRDSDTTLAWAGPQPAWWADRLGVDEPLARALVCAAVRETFEECGVLLAGPTSESVVPDTTGFGAARQSLVDREFSMAEFLAAQGLVLRADLLVPWSNWITPAEEPRRYDTRFFAAALPDGQRADGATTEASGAGWQRPQDAQADARDGTRALLPPTWTTLAELAACGDVAGVLAADRPVIPIEPRIVDRDGRVAVAMPGDADYPGA